MKYPFHIRTTSVLFTLFCALGGAVGTSEVRASDVTEWQPQTVYSSSYNAGQYLQKETDSSGVMHVVFYESETHKLYYTKSADGGATWAQAQIIDNRDGAGVKVQLTIDSQNNPRVAYLRRGNNALDIVEYAYTSNGVWSKMTVDRNDDDPYEGSSMDAPTVFVDGNNVVHVFYKPDQGVNTYFIDAELQPDGSWSKETVETNAAVCTYISDWQGIDSVYNTQTQKAHVAFKCTGVGSGTGMYIATLSNNQWSIATQNADYSGEGNVLSMIVEKNGTVGILHNDTSIEYNLYYTSLANGSTTWNTQLITSEMQLGYSDMTYDSAGNVHIAYTAAGAKLYYMQRTAAGWSSQLITYTEPSFQPQVGEVGIALNSQNTPVITFAGDRIVYSILPVTIQNTPTPTPTATPVPTTSPTPTSTPTPTPAPDEETLIQDRKITGLKQQKRSLSWATTQGAVKYKVVVYKKAHNTYKKVKTYTAKTTHVKIAKKYRSTSGKKFYFRVRGVDGEGHLSKWSKYKKIK